MGVSYIEIEAKNADHNCLVCDTAFDTINIGLKERVLVKRCNDCDGVFITEDILEQLIKREKDERAKVDYKVLRFIQENPRQKRETVIRYRKCPICENLMQRINYRAVSGVVVDRCLRHGVWLDGGELRQLFEWKKAGGSEKKELSPKRQSSNRQFSNKEYQEYIHTESPYFDPLGDFFTWLQGG